MPHPPRPDAPPPRRPELRVRGGASDPDALLHLARAFAEGARVARADGRHLAAEEAAAAAARMLAAAREARYAADQLRLWRH